MRTSPEGCKDMGLYGLKCGGLHSVTQQYQIYIVSETFQKLRLIQS